MLTAVLQALERGHGAVIPAVRGTGVVDCARKNVNFIHTLRCR